MASATGSARPAGRPRPTRSGPGVVLIAVYGLLALAATGRSVRADPAGFEDEDGDHALGLRLVLRVGRVGGDAARPPLLPLGATELARFHGPRAGVVLEVEHGVLPDVGVPLGVLWRATLAG